MKNLKLFLLLFCAMCLTACGGNTNAKVSDTQGNTFTLSQLHGKWVVINFWASWCDACREEVPALNNFNNKIKNSNVILYGINFDELNTPDLNAEMHKLNMQYPNLLTNPGWSWGLTDIAVLPTTFIISPKGQVIKKFVGGTTQKNLEDTLAMLQKTF